MGAVPFLLAIGGLPTQAQSLPAYCGAVGAKSYTPPVVSIPPVILNRGTVITVTNATSAVNGDISSVKALVANPGPDGISLYEAITATNNDPGTWNIQFAAALKGSTIGQPPYLKGGNVTINGDIDGDGQPDITLAGTIGSPLTLYILSGGITLNGLALQNCALQCVLIQRPSAKFQLPPATGTTFSNITISNMTMTDFTNAGIMLAPINGEPGLISDSPALATGNTWDHLLIIGNTISSTASGQLVAISLGFGGTAGDTLQHTTIANNKIVVSTQEAVGISMGIGYGLGATNNQALDTLIANNVIDAIDAAGSAIRISAGLGSGSANLLDGVQIVSNQIHLGEQYGIEIVNADAASDDLQPPVLPIQYSEGNIARNIGILSNTITGTSGAAIFVQEACCGNRNNVLSNLSIKGNTLTGVAGVGVWLVGGASGGYFSRTTSGNTLSNVLIQANTIQTAPLFVGGCDCWMALDLGGVQVTGGFGQPGNSVSALSIANNELDGTLIGISLIAGLGDGQSPFSADDNVMSAPQIFCNQVEQAPTLSLDPYPGTKGINVTAGVDAASDNQVSQLYVADNLIAGVLSAASTPAHLGVGGSGNTLTISSTPTPAISLVANAEGENPMIAPNTWIEIKGVNPTANTRIWQDSDFVGTQMPTALDQLSVTVNGKNAFVYYISPTQINVLTPPDAMSGAVPVVVTDNGAASASFTALAQATSPSLFVFNGGPYVAATHIGGSLIGPATLYPGASTPAQPGETIVIYANGFGPTSAPVQNGSTTQSGTLSPLPVITIGGVTAAASFAGLVAPGEFQFNVTVPPGLASGDQSVTATSGGATTQAGMLITILN
jgi:uncharacterized protein (TIGR03437 family)